MYLGIEKNSSLELDQNINCGDLMLCETTVNTANLTLDIKKKKLPKNGVPESASSTQVWEIVAQGRTFVLDSCC